MDTLQDEDQIPPEVNISTGGSSSKATVGIQKPDIQYGFPQAM